MSYTGDAHRFRRVEEIFHEIVELDSAEQDNRLRELCEGDVGLESEVRELLVASGVADAAVRPPADGHRADPWIGRDAGNYRIEKLLGRGGMGAVYLASRSDGEFQLRAAVKVLGSRLVSEWMLQRFAAERQILASLSHPNIVRLIDGGVTAEGEGYLVMEYVDGVPLDQWGQAAGSSTGQDLRALLTLFVRICDAVDAAHRKLIIHRDLKPGNILVTPEGEPKLLDFGTSKLIESRGTDGKAAAAIKSKLTELGFRAFTPEFASPEQVLGGAVSTASDVYSLGVILYRMVSGTHPYKFESQSSTEYVRVLRDVEPLAPSAASNRKELRGDLDAIVLKAMHKDPEQRYGAAADLAADLRAWLDGRPVSAQEPTLAYRASKFVRRHRGAIVAASVVAVFLATATILTAMAAREARREETRANRQFRNIRDLNRAILFDFFDAVQKLPGSMDVQKQIVNQSLDYITRMQRESPNDSESAYDLIEAYQRLGNVYANPYSDNLSNPKEGVQAMQRGLDIAYGLLKRNPSDDRARRLVASTEECLGEVLLGAGDADGAAEHMRKAIGAFEELASRADVTADLLAEVSAAHGALSDVMVGIYGGRRDEAIVESELRRAIELEYKALERDPKHIRARRGVAVSFFKLGRLVIETKPAEAVTAFEAAIQEIRRLPSEVQSSVDILRLIALMEWRTSGAWTLLGEYAKGLEHAHASRRISESLERLDPENARSQMDLAGALYIVANTHDYRAFATGSADDRREALRYYASHLVLLRKLITGNPKNQMLYAQLCESQLRVAQLQFKQGLNAQAVEALRESRKLAGELARSKDAEPAAIHRAAIVFGSSYLPESAWNLAEARQFAERLNEKTGYQRPEYLHTLGSIYNRLAMKPQALEIYKKAVALLPEDKPGTPRTVLSNEIREELAALTSNTAPSRPGK